MIRKKISIFALVTFTIFPGILLGISITIVYDDHFYDSFETGAPWQNVDPYFVKQFIEDRVTNDFSSYGIPVSVSQSAGPSLTVYIGRLTMPCSGLFGDATIGSYISGTTWCAVYSNEFACLDEWQGSNATASRIGEAIAGTASHELGHVLNLYHAYMFDTFDPTLNGALDSDYQPKKLGSLENSCPSCVTDPNTYYHLMATRSYISYEQRATINRYFADNSNQILKFAVADGADIYRNTTWGINNNTFTLLNDITIASGKTLIIAAGGYNHVIQAGRTNSFGNNAKLDVYGTLQAVGTGLSPITFTSTNGSPNPGDWKGIIINGSANANAVINYVNVKYALTNLQLINNSNNTSISNSTFTNAQGQGIRLDNSEPIINYCTIKDNGYYGMTVYNSYSTDWTNVDFLGNTIRDNGYYGMAIQNSSPTMEDNEISSNGIYGIYGIFGSKPVLSENRILSNSSHGTRWYSSSSPYLYYRGSYDFGGCNEISYNGGDGVYASNSSYPKLGSNYPGNNNIYSNSGYEVSNRNGGSSYIYARYNWWGSGGPSPSDFYGLVSYLPYLQVASVCGTQAASGGEPPAIQVENSPAYYNAMGMQLYGNGQVNAALQMFTNVLNRFPDSEGAFFALQQVIEIMREIGLQDQILPFLTVLSSDNVGTPLHWYADLQRVFILERSGNYGEAIQIIETVLQDSTIDTETEYATTLHRAMILANGLQQNEEAVQAYTEFLAGNPPVDLALIAQTELERLSGLPMPQGLGKRAVGEISTSQLPEKFGLTQNYPNPFNPITSIRYNLPEESRVVLKIYDLMGREVITLINKDINAGFKNIMWDSKDKNGRNVSSGMYFYRLDAVSKESNKEFHETKKMVLLR